MWKLAASLAAVAAVSGPVTVALAADEPAAPALPAVAPDQKDGLELRAAKAKGHRADTAAERKAERKAERRAAKRRAAKREAKAARRSSASSASSAGGGAATPAHLAAIAACESGGNPSAIGGGGAYRGKYQFDRGTWAAVGGSGDPAAASEAEQDRRAAALYARAGSSPWPVCGN